MPRRRSNAASDAATAARKACQAAAEAVRSAVEACRVGRSGENDDKTRRLEAILNAVCSRKLQVVWKAGFRVRTQAKYRVASRKAFEAGAGRVGPGGGERRATGYQEREGPMQRVPRECSGCGQGRASGPGGARRGKAEARSCASGGEGVGEASGKVHPADALSSAKKKGGFFR